jgi:hypothetical protein
MPIVTVSGIPPETPDVVLMSLRRNIVSAVAQCMTVRPDWVDVNMPEDKLPVPVVLADGARTISVRLETRMFHGLPSKAPVPKATVAALADIVRETFVRKYEVEVSVVELHPEWIVTLPAET